MLTEDDFHVPEDLEVLRRENELLALENRLLRGGGGAGGQASGRAVQQARLEEREKAREALHRVRSKHEHDTAERRARFASVPHDRLAELTKAESELRWLVGRLDGSPVGPVLRRWSGFRALRDKYLA